METSRATPQSLRMAEPAELAGAWEIVVGDRRCRVRLEPERVESANAYALSGGDCVAGLTAVAIGWRPAPDGIELVGADRLTLAMFADQGDGSGVARLPGGTATLRRAG